MHIVINGMFWAEPNTGSGQYLHGLVRTLPQVAPQHRYTLLVPPQPENATAVPADVSLVEIAIPAPNRQLAKIWFEQVGVPREAAKLAADLLFVPYAAAPVRASIPVVTTVHDIIWHLLPEYRGKAAFRAYARMVIAGTRRAAHILADSEHSRNDIVNHLRIDPEHITTVLLAAGEQYQPLDQAVAQAEVAKRYGLEQPFVYYVGGLDARKNIPTLLRAWAWLRRSGGPVATLAIAGRALSNDRQLFPDLDALIEQLEISDSVRRIDVPREDGPLLYNAATLFVAPSRYEGFGLGPLEAMACGTPVICSDASSLPEVVGDAALLVAPNDIPSWAGAIWRILADEQLRVEMRQRGLQRAAQFSYARVAHETIQVLEAQLTPMRKTQ